MTRARTSGGPSGRAVLGGALAALLLLWPGLAPAAGAPKAEEEAVSDDGPAQGSGAPYPANLPAQRLQFAPEVLDAMRLRLQEKFAPETLVEAEEDAAPAKGAKH